MRYKSKNLPIQAHLYRSQLTKLFATVLRSIKSQNWSISDTKNNVKISQYFLNITILWYFRKMQYMAFRIHHNTNCWSLVMTKILRVDTNTTMSIEVGLWGFSSLTAFFQLRSTVFRYAWTIHTSNTYIVHMFNSLRLVIPGQLRSRF